MVDIKGDVFLTIVDEDVTNRSLAFIPVNPLTQLRIHDKVTIHESGRVETNLPPGDAALVFWSAVENMAQDFILAAAERIKRERDNGAT